jgi:DNA-binding PadR family transcriptional regulator
MGMEQDQVIDNIILELRRGVLVLAVMCQLETEQYGYSLIKLLADHGLEIDQGTLYPLLRRLETQGLLESNWRIEEPRPRRYYVLSKLGVKVLPLIKAEWSKLSTLVEGII